MRNHRYIHKVLSAMLTFNSNEYIADVDDMITSNDYNSDINIYLSNISNLLNCYLAIISGNLNNQNNSYEIERIKNGIITNLFRIIAYTNNNEGKRCCDKLMNEEYNYNNLE